MQTAAPIVNPTIQGGTGDADAERTKLSRFKF